MHFYKTNVWEYLTQHDSLDFMAVLESYGLVNNGLACLDFQCMLMHEDMFVLYVYSVMVIELVREIPCYETRKLAVSQRERRANEKPL